MENHVNNYFSLQRVVDFLNTWLHDFYVSEILKSAKDEVQIVFRQRGIHKAVKFYLGEESFVFFPEKFFTPKKSQPFLQQLENKKFLEAVIHPHDRSFRIHFSDNFTLVILLFGRNANLILYQGKSIETVYNQKIKTNLDKPFNYYKNLAPATENEYVSTVENAGFKKAISTHFAGFTKEMLKHFKAEILLVKEPAEQWKILKEWERSLQNSDFHIYTSEKIPQGKAVSFSLLKQTETEVFSGDDIYAALNEYTRLYFKILQFNTQKKNLQQNLKVKTERAEGQLKSYYYHLDQLETEKNYKHQADLLMAYLHEIPKGAEKVELTDFDGEKKITIKLKREIPVQEWAEKLYQKAKKQQIERAQTETHIANIEKMLSELKIQRQQVELATDSQALRNHLPQQKTQTQDKKQQEATPYKKFEIEGFSVLVGKSAADNDKLTFGIAKKDDLWLHAKDVAGSHVIIQNPSRKEIPKTLLEKAAQLAAYYSKGKGSDLYPVLFTLKKFVRKPKGAGPGKVLVDKEKTLLVEPKLV
ncbi:MAG: NFACT RNA binding domain-containing protein [Bacteroidia bacterium]